MRKGDKVDRNQPCPICEKWIGFRGQSSHYMAHVRKGQMTAENDEIASLLITSGIAARQAARGGYVYLPPIVFRLAIDLD